MVAVGVRGHIIYSDDEGVSWAQASVPVRINLTSVTFVNDKLGWATGHGGIVLHSSDGGDTWTVQLDGDQVSRIVLASAETEIAQLEDELAALGDGGDEDLSWTLETATWRLEDAERDLEIGPAKPLMDAWYRNEREGYAVGAYGYFLHTRDGGKTWEGIRSGANAASGRRADEGLRQ